LPPLPTKAPAKAAIATTAIIAATMTNTATATATALTLAVTVLSKNMNISKLPRSIVLLGFQKKTGVTFLRQYWYSSTYGVLCTRATIWKKL
jgi:hypothetical protein